MTHGFTLGVVFGSSAVILVNCHCINLEREPVFNFVSL